MTNRALRRAWRNPDPGQQKGDTEGCATVSPVRLCAGFDYLYVLLDVVAPFCIDPWPDIEPELLALDEP